MTKVRRMSNDDSVEPQKKENNGGHGKLQSYGAPLVIFATTAILPCASWPLWITGKEKAQGAAIALVGVAASHLVKEAQQLLKSWLREE
jgi:hypothetical protein